MAWIAGATAAAGAGPLTYRPASSGSRPGREKVPHVCRICRRFVWNPCPQRRARTSTTPAGAPASAASAPASAASASSPRWRRPRAGASACYSANAWASERPPSRFGPGWLAHGARPRSRTRSRSRRARDLVVVVYMCGSSIWTSTSSPSRNGSARSSTSSRCPPGRLLEVVDRQRLGALEVEVAPGLLLDLEIGPGTPCPPTRIGRPGIDPIRKAARAAPRRTSPQPARSDLDGHGLPPDLRPPRPRPSARAWS